MKSMFPKSSGDGVSDERFNQIMQQSAPSRPSLDNLKEVDWPKIEYYGFEHHRDTAAMAARIAESLELKPEEVNQVYLAGLLHDLGRSELFGKPDPAHYQRGADIAEKILRGSQYWAQEELINGTCKLITQHGHTQLSDTQLADPLLTSLQEAERFECVRYAIGTPSGIMLIKKVCNIANMRTPYGKNGGNVRNWMNFKGW